MSFRENLQIMTTGARSYRSGPEGRTVNSPFRANGAEHCVPLSPQIPRSVMPAGRELHAWNDCLYPKANECITRICEKSFSSLIHRANGPPPVHENGGHC